MSCKPLSPSNILPKLMMEKRGRKGYGEDTTEEDAEAEDNKGDAEDNDEENEEGDNAENEDEEGGMGTTMTRT